MHEPEALAKLKFVMKTAFTIADEVMTGFGKTGKTLLWIITLMPDMMMCLSRTGGTINGDYHFYQDIFDAFMMKISIKPCFHGHTFTATYGLRGRFG
jgi:adenosylmethionine-8-amino-7-oxononanoate aminotransferase